MEIVAHVFIGILQNIFQSWTIIFSQSPEVVFWMNCAFPLTSFAGAFVTNFENVFLAGMQSGKHTWRFLLTSRTMCIPVVNIHEDLYCSGNFVTFDNIASYIVNKCFNIT